MNVNAVYLALSLIFNEKLDSSTCETYNFMNDLNTFIKSFFTTQHHKSQGFCMSVRPITQYTNMIKSHTHTPSPSTSSCTLHYIMLKPQISFCPFMSSDLYVIYHYNY